MSGTLDNVILECMGDVDGPRILRGQMRGDHSVSLVTLLNGHNNDTHWRRGVNSDGSLWNLRCLGDPPPGAKAVFQFLGHRRGGGVLIAPKAQMPDGNPEIWRARPVAGMANTFTLENIALRDVGIAERFLDGRTQNGSVGLGRNTNPPLTGTRWRVSPVPRPAGSSGPMEQ